MNEKSRPIFTNEQQDEQSSLSLTARLARHVLARKGAVSTGNRGLVTGLKNEISKALGAGFSVKDVFRMLTGSGQVKCSYQSFRLHVNTLVGPKKTRRQTMEGPKHTEQVSSVISRPPPLPTFTWNPTPNPKDLI